MGIHDPCVIQNGRKDLDHDLLCWRFCFLQQLVGFCVFPADLTRAVCVSQLPFNTSGQFVIFVQSGMQILGNLSNDLLREVIVAYVLDSLRFFIIDPAAGAIFETLGK